MGKRKRNFVIRTIKDGQVKIYGKMFKPTDKWLEYDGRLDGQRWAFGLYWTREYLDVPGVPANWTQLPFVELWGTEKAYFAAYKDETWEAYREAWPIMPGCIQGDDGAWYYPWATWRSGEEKDAWRRA